MNLGYGGSMEYDGFHVIQQLNCIIIDIGADVNYGCFAIISY
jgi:hypothetical protein